MKGLKLKVVLFGLVFFGLFIIVGGLIDEMTRVIGAVAGADAEQTVVEASDTAENKSLSKETMALATIVNRYAAQYGIPNEVPYILALIEVESGGRGLDPMQSSESIGLPPNSINSVDLSIKQGVIHYKNCLAMAKEYGITDKGAAIQSYNYGAGFIVWLAKNNKQYSFESGVDFAKEQAGGATTVYTNPIADFNGNVRYLYGNMYYTLLVMSYVSGGNSSSGSASGKYVLPVDSPNISSGFGWRTLFGESDFHRGLDFANPYGSNIKAIASGKVAIAGQHWSWGNYVVIVHDDGKASLYAHQSAIFVTVNQSVKAGDKIGQIGSTGNSTGPHLHLELAKSNNFSQDNLLDPSKHLPIN